MVAGGLAGALPGSRSVDRDDLKTGAVASRAIKNDSVKSKDIRDETIQSRDIRDGTVSADDLAPRPTTGYVSFPAQALNQDPGSAVITDAPGGLEWTNSGAESAELFIHRPADWTGSGIVTLKLLATRDTAVAGNLQFSARPRNYDAGDVFSDSSGVLSNVQSEAGSTQFRELTIEVQASSLPRDWWHIVIQRNSSPSSPCLGDVFVRSVELTYEARN